MSLVYIDKDGNKYTKRQFDAAIKDALARKLKGYRVPKHRLDDAVIVVAKMIRLGISVDANCKERPEVIVNNFADGDVQFILSKIRGLQ